MIAVGAAAALEELYASLPTIECSGLCHNSCGPIAMSRLELERLRRASGRRATFDPQTLTCSYLTAERRCSVYASRPLICRVFGVDRKMPCPFGCQPSRWLTEREGRALLEAAEQIGGEVELAVPMSDSARWLA